MLGVRTHGVEIQGNGQNLIHLHPLVSSTATPCLRAKLTLSLSALRVNNAGTNAYKYGPLSEAKDDELIQIVETNVLGVMLGCREVSCWPRQRLGSLN